jgi:hypothetical protein
MKAFKEWCEDNGRRWIGVLKQMDGYAEFEKNAKDYEEYREEVEQDEHERHCLNRVAPLG